MRRFIDFCVLKANKYKSELQMGLTSAFEMRHSEFSGLSIPYHPWVQVSNIFQKSTIEVVEWGVAASSSIACKFRFYREKNCIVAIG